MDKKQKISRRKTIHLHILAGTVLPIVITAGLMFLSPLLIVTFLPLRQFFSAFSKKILSEKVILPKADIDEIPDTAPVLVVITALLTGEKNDCALFDKLESIYYSCGGRNIYFGVLADIRDSKTAKAPGDGEILDYACGRIDSLCSKHGSRFMLFERRRIYSKSEETFMCRDRKRGAVCELISFLKGGKTTFTDRTENSAKEILDGVNIKYIVTLDPDITPALSSVTDMCSAMLHPLSMPVIDSKKGIVTKGYGIMQPCYVQKTPKKNASLFCRIMHGNPPFSFNGDTFGSINGESVFSGNGIIDVDAYYRVIIENNAFPEDTVLNHAILESAKLRCAVIHDLKFTYTSPENRPEYTARLHERIRGDIQNLVFFFKHTALSKNGKMKNNLSGIAKLQIADRALSAVTPIFAVSGIFCAMISKGTVSFFLTAFSLLYTTAPFLFPLTSVPFRKLHFSQKIKLISQSAAAMIFNLSMLPALAFSSLDAISKALYRSLISHRNLLQKSKPSQEDGLCGSVHTNIICAFTGFILLVFTQSAVLSILALLWFSFPVISYRLSLERKIGKEKIPESLVNKAKKQASDIWRFYADTVNEKRTRSPINTVCHSPCNASAASPSDIGFYLLSVLCARDFGFVSTAEMEKRITETVTTAECLKKYKGHLYSSYVPQSLTVLPSAFISTSESAYFTACLITLRMGLLEYVSESTSLIPLIKRITALEECQDFGIFYNRQSNSLSKGIYVTEGKCNEIRENCQPDETALAGYILCAKRQLPGKYLSKLSELLSPMSENSTDGIFLYGNNLAAQFNITDSEKKVQNPAINICRLCNLCFENLLRERFLCDSRMSCAKELILPS